MACMFRPVRRDAHNSECWAERAFGQVCAWGFVHEHGQAYAWGFVHEHGQACAWGIVHEQTSHSGKLMSRKVYGLGQHKRGQASTDGSVVSSTL